MYGMQVVENLCAKVVVTLERARLSFICQFNCHCPSSQLMSKGFQSEVERSGLGFENGAPLNGIMK